MRAGAVKEVTMTAGGPSQIRGIPWFLPPTLQGHPVVESRSQWTRGQRAGRGQSRVGKGGGIESTVASHWRSKLGRGTCLPLGLWDSAGAEQTFFLSPRTPFLPLFPFCTFCFYSSVLFSTIIPLYFFFFSLIL